MNFLDQISKDRGQPATVRIGTVIGVNPLVVSVQGGTFDSESVGVAGFYVPAVGDVVALLGQSAISADGSSWLVLGEVALAANTAWGAVSNFAQEAYTTTSTSYTTAGPSSFCSVAFIAPPSGKVLITWTAEIAASSAIICLISPQIATGPGPASGTVVAGQAVSDDRTVRNDNTGVNRTSHTDLVSGLTPGTQYNCALYHRVISGTGTISRRRVVVAPTV